MSKDKDAAKPEVVAVDKADGEPEPETVEALIVEWDGESWEVPAADDMPYDATVAFARLAKAAEDGDRSMSALVHGDDFLRALLGPAQYRRLVRTRKVGQVNEFPAAVFDRWGAEQGE